MKDIHLLVIMIAFLIGCCFQKIMCNNILIEGEEIEGEEIEGEEIKGEGGGGEIKKTCANINADDENPVKFPCNDAKYFGQLFPRDDPENIVCEGECTGGMCCYERVWDDDDDDDPFWGNIGTFVLAILAGTAIVILGIILLCGFYFFFNKIGDGRGVFGGVIFLCSLIGLVASISSDILGLIIVSSLGIFVGVVIIGWGVYDKAEIKSLLPVPKAPDKPNPEAPNVSSW